MPKYNNRNITVTFPGQVQTKEKLHFLGVSSLQDHHQIPIENTVTQFEIRTFSFEQGNCKRYLLVKKRQ